MRDILRVENEYMGSIDSGISSEQQAPQALLTHLKFSILTKADIENLSVLSVGVAADVTNAKLGLPNEASECSTCGATDLKNCDGHFGILYLKTDICHPYYVTELVKILNNICPVCKSHRSEVRTKQRSSKGKSSKPANDLSTSCNYCGGGSEKFSLLTTFKRASRDAFGKVGSAVLVKASDKLGDELPPDFWKFIEHDPSQEEINLNSKQRHLSPSQVYHLLKDVDAKYVEKLIRRRESVFLTCLLVTPNGNRLMEAMNKIIFDERTKAYKRLVEFKEQANELGSRVRDCLGGSKLHSGTSSSIDIKSGLKWMKDVVLAKRTDHSFRLVVVGDPKIKFGEIGISRAICQLLMVSETLNNYNQEKLRDWCNWSLLEFREFRIRRKGDLLTLKNVDALEMGDSVYRHLDDGDVILVNRPPTIHQHSLIALSVRVLPMDSVVSLNPVCCSPLRGDFDGDCLHGFIPQSIRSKVELRELVSINHQLVDGQNGRNLLSLCHDSLTAAYLLRKEGVFLDKYEMQQLKMLCHTPCEDLTFRDLVEPKASTDLNPLWRGDQLFSMLFPLSFNYESPSRSLQIKEGEIMKSSLESSWLQNTEDNIFSCLLKSYGSKALDILFSVQEVLLEWISMRGFSVSLSDLYLCSDSYSRRKMLEEVYCGLDEAEQSFHTKQLMTDPAMRTVLMQEEDYRNFEDLEVGNAIHLKEVSDLNRLSVGAFKEVFRDIQNQILHYSGEDNSLLAMVKAGSKGNLLKLVQQGVTLGLQYSSIPLSFNVPSKPSYRLGSAARDSQPPPKGNVPYAVVENSFFDGLNPMECFMHSVSSRSTSFADNADVPGTLHRNMMFYMRDIYLAYDGTVRNLNGNQLVQFSYGVGHCSNGPFVENSYCFGDSGSPVGSLAACSISEAAYSALDQPISTLESSPLLNVKKLLESSPKKKVSNQTVSLFLSKYLARWLYGFEYGAIKVKSHLESVFFSNVVSTVLVTIVADPNHNGRWICHFHLHKEEIKKRGLSVHFIRDVLEQKLKFLYPEMQIFSGFCSEVNVQKEDDRPPCIRVATGLSSCSPMLLSTLRDSVIPSILDTVIKGFSEIKKVEISWRDMADPTKSGTNVTGELYLKVHLSCKNEKCWSFIMDKCLPIMDLIDWGRSSPDDIADTYSAFGISCSREYFLTNLKAAVSDIGKSILPEHLVLLADCFSVTGDFIGLNAKGIAKQRDLASVSSPFTQACFSRPESCFIKAAKEGAEDHLLGALDAAAWGKEVPLGTGGQFDLSYSAKPHDFTEPIDVYGTLRCDLMGRKEKDAEIWVPVENTDLCGKEGKESTIRMVFPILKRVPLLQRILHNKYSVNTSLDETDKGDVMWALSYHPRSTEKIGTGVQDIKVDYHPKFPNSRCFFVIRKDGSVEDFSYRKCITEALRRLNLSADFVDRLKKICPHYVK